MPEKLMWHRTTPRCVIVVDENADVSLFPDYEDVEGPHHSVITKEQIEEMDRHNRQLRNAELARTDYMVLPDMNPTQELLEYRQALRDAPATEGWPLVLPNITKLPE